MKTKQFILCALVPAFIMLSLNCFAQVNLNSGLLAHYPLDGNANSTAGASGYDLTNYSATLTTDHYGNANSAYYFNGSTYLQGSFAATGYTGMTVSAWINTTYSSNNEVITGEPNGCLYVNRFTASRFMGFFDGSSGNNSSSDQTTVSVENGWTFVAATSDGSTTRLYVNGVFNHSYSETMGNSATNGEMFIGNNYGGTTALFQGSIDEVRVYTRALSANEILALYQMPKAAFSGTNECAGIPVPFMDKSDTIVAHNHYLWRFGDGSTDTSRNPKHLYKTSGNFTVWMIITSPAGGADSISQAVTVYPLPGSDFKDSSIDGRIVLFTATGAGLTSYTWNFGDKTGSSAAATFHTYNRIGKYNVKLITQNANGCKDSLTKSVTAFEIPKADFSVQNVCIGQPAVFKNSSSDTSFATYAWNFGDNTTSVDFSPKHIYTAAGIYQVTLIVSNILGYSDTATQNLVVYARPDAGFKIAAAGTKVSFTPDDLSFSSYLWDFGDTSSSSAKQPSHIYSNYGTYKVSLTVKNANGCDSTFTRNVNVSEAPVADFSFANTCAGRPTYFTDMSKSKLSLVYSWNFGDQASSTTQNPGHVYANPGNYTVMLKITNNGGGSDSISRQVTIYALPDAVFKTSVNGYSAAFAPSDTTYVFYSWNFGDSKSSTAKSPTHLYLHTGNFLVTLTVANAHGCDSTYSQTISIVDVVSARFSAKNVCLGNPTQFSDSSRAGSSVSYSWNFGDQSFSSAQNPSHTYASAGSYNVKLKIMDAGGQSDSLVKQVTVYPLPSARFGFSIDDYKVSFVPKDITLSSYSWDFGDSNSSSIIKPVHVYGYKSTFGITLQTTNIYGCDSTLTQAVTVNGNSGLNAPDTQIPGFTLYPNPVCNGMVRLSANGIKGDCGLTVFGMDGKVLLHKAVHFNGTGTEKGIDVSGLKTGTYIVQLETRTGVITHAMVIQ